MQVTLKVIGGKNDGREIKISVPQFIIGRGEQAHLRPSSDLISRQHCAINIGDGKVTIEDLGSRNGTVVNEEVLSQPHVARIGDILKVGRLQFEVLIDHAQSGAKKPRVQSVAEVAQRTANKNGVNEKVDEDSITDWLAEPVTDPDREVSETRQFRLDETTQLFPSKPEESDAAVGATEAVEEEEEVDATKSDESSSGIFGRKKKKEKGKLPPKPKFSADSSTTAADDVLKKFFNRR